MLQLGSFLKTTREEKGFSLEDVQEITKIKVGYLQAIEEGNYDALPGLFYVRAFVKTYCEALGLPAQEVMDIYKSDLPGADRKSPAFADDVNDSLEDAHRPTQPSFFNKWGASLIVWSVAVIILLAIYYLITNLNADQRTNQQVIDTQSNQTQVKQPTNNESMTTKDKTQPSANKADDSDKNQAFKIVSQTKSEFVYRLHQSKSIKLQMTAKNECYVHYGPLGSNKIYALETLKSGQSLEWTANESISMRVGAMENLQLTVNGNLVDFSGYVGVRTLVFQLQ